VRHRRHTRRSGGKARQVRWINSHMWSDLGQIGFQSGDRAVAWMKWPAGHINTQFDILLPEPSDETLIRSIWWPSLTRPGTDLNPVNVEFWSFGLIAWDAFDPNLLDRQLIFANDLSAPDPYFGSDDWILKHTFIVNSPDGADFATSIPPGAESQVQSRAMRKLPPDTGILGVLSLHQQASAGGDTCSATFGLECRLAVKSGYSVG